MGAAYSDDLRKKALEAIARGERPSAVAQLLGISRNTLNLWRQQHAQSGSYAPKRGYQRGHSAKITDWEEFRAFAHQHGGKTLAEMAALRGVGYMTISRGLQKIGFTRKKRGYGYRERNDAARYAFLAHIATLDPQRLIYLDEAGMDDNEDYPWGWCAKGQRFWALKQGHRRQRISLIAALHDGQLIAPMTFEGYCDRAVFTAWLKRCLLPLLSAGQTLILDNARFHFSAQIQAAVAKAGCRLLYLPAYSPDLNPIEQRWAALKNRIRKNIPRFHSLQEAVHAAFV
ncbi:MAG: IS630 family transposase [Gammaproteobacteria bacterium]